MASIDGPMEPGSGVAAVSLAVAETLPVDATSKSCLEVDYEVVEVITMAFNAFLADIWVRCLQMDGFYKRRVPVVVSQRLAG